ncbi:MAG: glucose-1-phosphate adenylyltransferase [Fidelibacterota bacterium]
MERNHPIELHRKFQEILKRTLTIILAGGQGERLFPLTKDRSKPAVPFGGIYRIIDFSLSNCLNSGLRKIYCLTQYKSYSLERHIRMGWNIFNRELNEFVYTIPPQQRMSNSWYLGTADAVYQNIYIIEQENPELVLILSGDHVYKMDYSKLLEYHIMKNADLTVCSVQLEKEKASSFGVIQIDENNLIKEFQEKPADPATIPHNPGYCLVNMGVYLFNTDTLIEALLRDSKIASEHDFGKNIIPELVKSKNVFAFGFGEEEDRGGYWRDIGTVDAYYESSMDLVQVNPKFNVYDRNWPIRTYHGQYPPAKTVFSGEEGGRKGEVLNSIISNGCIISGSKVENSILSPNVRIHSFCRISQSIIMEDVEIQRHAKIKRAIIDKHTYISSSTIMGYDLKRDGERFFVTRSGIVVIPRLSRI